MTKKEVKIGVFGAVASVICTAIYDLIKEKPVLSSLWSSLKWVWETVLEFEFKVWHIIIGLFLIRVLSKVLTRKSNPIQDYNDWLSYLEDSIDGIIWRWNWDKSPLTQKWSVQNLHPVCDKCQTSMHIKESGWGSQNAECPRCDNTFTRLRDLSKIESVIVDNVKRDLYKNKFYKSQSKPNHG